MHGCERATRYLMPAFWLPAQAVEHYEISRYGTLATWAKELGFPEAVELLEATLQEEKNTDKILTGIAKSVVNVEAEEDETEET